MKCAFCGKNVIEKDYPKEKWSTMIARYRKTGRIYCCPDCGKKWAHRNLTSFSQSDKWRKTMQTNNPMSRKEIREKVSKTLREHHHKPPKHGGNGTGLTEPQKLLLIALRKHKINVVPELPIKTHQKRGSGYPTCYKVDIGIEDSKLAIEIDGISHYLLERQRQDLKKDTFLNQLGWKVLRFKNKEVLENTNKVMEKILSII